MPSLSWALGVAFALVLGVVPIHAETRPLVDLGLDSRFPARRTRSDDSLVSPTTLTEVSAHAANLQTATVGDTALVTWEDYPEEVHGLLLTRDGEARNSAPLELAAAPPYTTIPLSEDFAIVWIEVHGDSTTKRLMLQRVTPGGETHAPITLLESETLGWSLAAHWNGLDLAIAWPRGSSMFVSLFTSDGTRIGDARELPLGRGNIAATPSFLPGHTHRFLVWGRGSPCPILCPYFLRSIRIDDLDGAAPPIEVYLDLSPPLLLQRSGGDYVMIENEGWVTRATRIDASGTVVQSVELDPLIKGTPGAFVVEGDTFMLATVWNRTVLAAINPQSLAVEWIASSPPEGWNEVRLPWTNRAVWLEFGLSGGSPGVLQTAAISKAETVDIGVEADEVSRSRTQRVSRITVTNHGPGIARDVQVSIGAMMTIESTGGSTAVGFGDLLFPSLTQGESREIIVTQPLLLWSHYQNGRSTRYAMFDALRVAVASPVVDVHPENNSAQLPQLGPSPTPRRGAPSPSH